MATILSNFAKGTMGTAVSPGAGTPVVNRFWVDLTAAQLVANDVIDLGILPAGHTITHAVLIPDDLDTGAGITLDVGLMTGTVGDGTSVRTVGTELFAATTAAQTGAATTATAKSAYTISAAATDRSIGVKIVAAPVGGVAGRLRLQVSAVPVNSGSQF